MTTDLRLGDHVRHNVHLNRGNGVIRTISRALLRSQAPKYHVAFERGGLVWCFADDLTVVAPSSPVSRPVLTLAAPAPAVA